MKIEISDDKSSATIDGVEYELKQKGKKISEWLNELPDGYRELALANFKEQGKSNDVFYNIGNVIFYSFDWENTKENYYFWNEVYNYLLGNISDLPPLPKPKFEVWKPKVGEKIFAVDDYGRVISTENKQFYMLQYLMFQNKEQAIEAHEKAMFNYEVEMFIKEKNGGWIPDYSDSSSNKYRIVYDVSLKRLSIEASNSRKHVSDEKVPKTLEIGEEIIAKFDNEKLVKWWI